MYTCSLNVLLRCLFLVNSTFNYYHWYLHYDIFCVCVCACACAWSVIWLWRILTSRYKYVCVIEWRLLECTCMYTAVHACMPVGEVYLSIHTYNQILKATWPFKCVCIHIRRWWLVVLIYVQTCISIGKEYLSLRVCIRVYQKGMSFVCVRVDQTNLNAWGGGGGFYCCWISGLCSLLFSPDKSSLPDSYINLVRLYNHFWRNTISYPVCIWNLKYKLFPYRQI